MDTSCVAVDVLVGISVAWAEDWEVFPNPADRMVQLRFPAALPSMVRLEVFRSDGARIWEADMDGRDAVLPVEGWPAGVYWLRLAAGDQWMFKQVVVVH